MPKLSSYPPLSSSPLLPSGESLGPFVTVGPTGTFSDYICDGVADDVEIQAAGDALNTAGGGVLYIRPGTYTTSDFISIASWNNISVKGAGIDVTIFLNHGFKKNSSNTTSNMQFQDFTVNANSVGTTAMHISSNSYSFRLSRLKLMNSSSSFCLNWGSNDALVVEDCYILDGGLTVAADNCAGSQLVSTNNTSVFRNCQIIKQNSLGGGLITTGQTGNLLIDGCALTDLSNNSYAGVSVENQAGNSLDVTIVNNHFYRVGVNLGVGTNSNTINTAIAANNKVTGVNGANSSGFIGCRNVLNGTINGNIGTDCSTGFTIVNSGYIKAKGNKIKNTNTGGSASTSDHGGFYLSGNTVVELEDNTVWDDQGVHTTPYGINIVGGSQKVYLSNNKLLGTFTLNSIRSSGTQSFLAANNNDYSGGTQNFGTITTLYSTNNIGKEL